jgi:hypothetical protein
VFVAGIFRPFLSLLAAEFSGRIWYSSYLPEFSGLTFSSKGMLKVSHQRPESRDFPAVSVVSGLDFPAVAFLAWVILKKIYGRQTNCSGIDSGIFCP